MRHRELSEMPSRGGALPWGAIAMPTGEGFGIAQGGRRPFPERGLSVLMIGGSPADLMLQGFVLADIGSVGRVDSAPDPVTGARLLEERPPQYDLVLMTASALLTQPDQLVRTVMRRQRDRNTGELLPPVVLVAERAGLGREASAPFAATLPKPLRHDHLQHLIDRLFER